jgi:hypothetical protein
MAWSLRLSGVALLVAMASVASGQQVQQVDAAGKITGFAPGGIIMKSLANTTLFLSFDPSRTEGNVRIQGLGNPVAEVTGTMGPDGLQKGMVVRMLIELDMRKQVGEISEVTVLGYSAPENTQFGLLPEGGAIGGDDAPKKGPKILSGKFILVGQLDSARGGLLDVEFPGGKQKAKVAADATVRIETGEYANFARVGDDIRVEGVSVVPGKVMVAKATITRVAKAAGGGDDGPKRPPAAKPGPMAKTPPGRKPKEDDGPGKFGIGDPRAEAPPAVAGEVARPKEKGKVLKVN